MKTKNTHSIRCRILQRIALATSILAIAWLFCLPVYGLGFRIPNQDAAATARGNAFVATADNPAALYYNPAGITQLEGHNVQLGAHIISVNSHFRSPTGVEEDTEFEIQPVPQFYYAYSPAESSLSYGLGIYAPFGLGLQWPDDNPFRTLAIEGRLMYVTINPVVAWQVNPRFSVAAGPTLNYARAKLRQGVLLPGDQFEFRGDDYAFGFSASALWQPHEQWSFGVAYRSPTTMNFRGGTETKTALPLFGEGNVGTSAEADFPQFVTFGVSFRPTTHWNVEVDVDWTDWDTLDSVKFEGTRALFGRDVVFPLNWQSSFLYHLGVTRYFGERYFASAGYFFSENSTSEKNFNPIVPDTDLHVASLGFGYKGKHWSWAISGQIITGPAREVDESVSTSLVGHSANGKYDWFNQAVNVSVGYHY